MPTSQPRPPDDPGGERDLSATYIKVILVQLAVLAALYWLNVHFA